MLWMRAKGGPSSQEHQNLNRVALAYASDFSMATIVLLQHPDFKLGLATSLDHSIWFHTPVQGDKWYLFISECEYAIGECALNFCR